MKKLLPTLVIISILVAPTLALAQESVECCKLGREIKWTSGKVDSTDCTVASPSCTLEKGQTVGPDGAKCPMAGKTSAVGSTPDKKTEQWGIICVINTVNTIVDWFFAFLVIFAVFYVILGAYNILTSAGEAQKMTSGRNYILYAAIGLLVAFIARAIPSLVKSIMGF